MNLFDDPAEEIARVAALARRRAQQQQRATTADAETAKLAARLAGTHVGMQAGVILALAKAGHGPDSPVVQEAARRSNARKSKWGTGWHEKGRPVKAREIASLSRRRERWSVPADPWIPSEGEPTEATIEARVRQMEARRARSAAQQTGQPLPLDELEGPDVPPIGPEMRADAAAHRMFARSPNLVEPDRLERGLLQEELRQRAAGPGGLSEMESLIGGNRMIFGREATSMEPGPIARGAVRAAGIGADALYRYPQGVFRNVVSGKPLGEAMVRGLRETDVGVIAETLAEGDRVDIGHGFLVDPESEVAKERLRREREGGMVGGHVITPGRWVANLVFEPGSTPFNIASGLLDATAAIKADPSAVALSRIGAVRGLRNTIASPQAADHWLMSEGADTVDWLARNRSFGEAWRKTNKQIPTDILVRTLDASTGDEVRDILRPALGVEIRGTPGVQRFGRPLGTVLGGNKGYVRLAGTMPAHRIDLADTDDAVEQLDRVLRTAKIPLPEIDPLLERMARATGSRHQQYAVLTDAMTAVTQRALGAGVDPKEARRFGTLFLEQHDRLRRYFVDELGENVDFPGVTVNAAGGPKPSPHLFAEVLNRYVPLPDARQIRQAISPFRRILRNPAVKYPRAVLDVAIGRLWKDSVLLRLAYPIRVVGEEQARMAAAGLDSMFRHPISYISYMVGRSGGEDLLGNAWDDVDQYRKALTRGSAGFRDPSGVHRTRHWDVFTQDDDAFLPSWADELGQLHADPVARKILDEPDLQAVKDWFWNGAGGHLRRDLIVMRDENRALARRRHADRYIDTVLNRISIKTGGDSDLIDTLRTGNLNGVRISDDGAVLNRRFVNELAAKMDIAPANVKGQLRVEGVARFADDYNRAAEFVFSYLMGKPTNVLSRSKSFEQFYWRRVGELMPFMDDTAQQTVIGRAAKLKLPREVRAAIRKTARRGTDALTVDDVDVVAKGHALDDTKGLLYDLSERGQFFDAFRLIFPFGEAWKEMVTRWPKLLADRPQIARRLQQGIQTARSSGFFYENENGDEVFAYPGSAWVNEKLMGVPIPFTGRVQGLSLMTEVLPGFGPAVQIPAAAFLPDKPEWDRVRSIVLPFGEPGGDTIRDWMPPWLQKFATALVPTVEMQKAKAGAAQEIIRYGASIGEYDLTTPEGVARAEEDAIEKATQLFLIRGFAQLGAPSAPSPEFVVQDKDGNIQVIASLRRVYSEKAEAPESEDGFDGDYDAAFAWFVETYGWDLAPVLQGKTYSVVASTPVTKEGEEWERSHPGYRKRYPHVYGYFAPQGGKFDFDAYRRTFERDERVNITVEQFVKLSNNRVGNHLYRRLQDQLPERPTKEQQDWLRGARDALRKGLPGFQEELNLPGRLDPSDERHMSQLTREFERALKDEPELRDSETGEAISTYLDLRRQASQESVRRGLSPTGYAKAKAAQDLRDWLRQAGLAFGKQRPGFRAVWDEVFDRELAEDEG